MKLKAWMDRTDKAEAEVERLRLLIVEEAVKWGTHHTDPAKQAYWIEFGMKAGMPGGQIQ